MKSYIFKIKTDEKAFKGLEEMFFEALKLFNTTLNHPIIFLLNFFEVKVNTFPFSVLENTKFNWNISYDDREISFEILYDCKPIELYNYIILNLTKSKILERYKLQNKSTLLIGTFKNNNEQVELWNDLKI